MAGDARVSGPADPAARAAEARAERRALRNGALACLAVAFGVYVINSASIMTVMERAGSARPAIYPWVLEGTAMLALFAAFPAVILFARRFPLEPGRWRRSLAAHLAGLDLYAGIQISLMLALRYALWPLVFGQPYVYGDEPVDIAVYEARKQAGIYVGFQAIFWAARHIEQLRLEAHAARREARREQRIALKCGGRSYHLAAADFLSARAAGNYVEARFGAREHLARITLGELETLLKEAGIDAVRCHRSFLVNRARIAEIVPTGEGDVTVRLDEGSEVPGSRRYRAELEGQAGPRV